MAVGDDDFDAWIRGRKTYTSPDNQNELLDIMSRMILRTLRDQITETKYYTLMVDESPDTSNKEQVVFCLWYEEI